MFRFRNAPSLGLFHVTGRTVMADGRVVIEYCHPETFRVGRTLESFVRMES